MTLRLVALDIETSGLEWRNSCLLAVGLFSSHEGGEVLVGKDEADMLRELESYVLSLPVDTVLVTWNGEEFDLPFLHHRFRAHQIETALRLRRRKGRGKYGGPTFAADWGGRRHIDIAPLLKDEASAKNVQWSLKPVARAILGVEPVVEDRRGTAIAALSPQRLSRYVLSDARVTSELADRLSRSGSLA